MGSVVFVELYFDFGELGLLGGGVAGCGELGDVVADIFEQEGEAAAEGFLVVIVDVFANGADAEVFGGDGEGGGIFEVAFEVVEEGADVVSAFEDVGGDEFEFGCELEGVDDVVDGGDLCVEGGEEAGGVLDGFVGLEIGDVAGVGVEGEEGKGWDFFDPSPNY